MPIKKQLEDVITNSVIPDIEDRLDEIFEEIADKKDASESAKEEVEELREFKADLEDVVKDIQNGEMDDEEAAELLEDILSAQRCEEE
jgi:polyhydroxyalkanoate synthesis regulator phasin